MIKERILQFLSNEGLSPSQFAEVLGIQRSSISHILSGRNKPSYDFFNKLINSYPNINLEWFFTGSGSIYKENIVNEPIKIDVEDIKHENLFVNENKESTTEFINVNKIKQVITLFTDGTFEVFHNKN